MRRQDLGFVRDSGTPICPTLTFTANIVAWGKDTGVDPNYIETKKRELDALVEIHRRAHEAGVPLLVGSESGFSLTRYGEWHARELELMVELLGMTPMAAIVAATRTNAEALGWAGQVGTLQAGARADLLIVDGDPLRDIRVLGQPEKIVAVIKDGVEVDRSTPIPERRRMSHERGYNVSTEALSRAETRGRVPR